MKKLTVLGSINADHVINVPHFSQPGETLMGNHYHIAYGGKGANQAVAAAKLGGRVDFIACIGDDELGRAMKKSFAELGINTESILEIENQTTGIAMIQVADSGENSIVISAGANAHLDEQVVQHCADKIRQADSLLMQLETPLPAIMMAAQIAKQAQTKVILNPAPAQPLPTELLALVDMITPNQTETEILTGIHVSDEQSAQQATQIFHQQGIAIVLITLGAQGVYVSQQGQAGKLISGFKVQAKDTTAAGDTFNGALITALLEDQSLEQAITFAQAAAAISVTCQGAQSSIPSREETQKFIAQYSL